MPLIHATDRDGARHAIEAETDLSLMLNLRDVGGLDIAAVCGGVCSCGTCHVYVDPEWMDRVPPQAIDELEVVEVSAHHRPNSRLSCQIRMTPALDGLSVTLAPED